MVFELDDVEFQLKAMKSPDYPPLVENRRKIERLQERISLLNTQLITERDHKERIMKEIDGTDCT